MSENLVTGRKFRILTDAVHAVWDRISFWTKASDVYYDDNSTAEDNKPINILKRSTAYTYGTIVYELTAPSWVMLKCTTAGTTDSSVPTTYSTISTSGTVIRDGTARFTVYDIRVSTTLSTSSYQPPAMSLVNRINSELIADNGDEFHFAYDASSQKYGYKINGLDPFIPFGNNDSFSVIQSVTVPNGSTDTLVTVTQGERYMVIRATFKNPNKTAFGEANPGTVTGLSTESSFYASDIFRNQYVGTGEAGNDGTVGGVISITLGIATGPILRFHPANTRYNTTYGAVVIKIGS